MVLIYIPSAGNASGVARLRSRSDGFVFLLALLLLMLRVLADNHDAAFALNDLALLANGFHTRSYFHGGSPFDSCSKSRSKKGIFPLTSAFAAPGNTPAGQIIRGQLHGDLITRQDTNEVHS
jgi:hypothetical protein